MSSFAGASPPATRRSTWTAPCSWRTTKATDPSPWLTKSSPPGRRPFIGLGPEGTFWSKTLWPDGQAHRVGDELWFYFAGLDVSHKEQSILKSSGGRGRAVLRLDGFISADAGGAELLFGQSDVIGDKQFHQMTIGDYVRFVRNPAV